MNEWHFPRQGLAEHYLDLLSLGISSYFALIAPRRKGKTLFILQDLAPQAQKKKYLPVYASLWQNMNSPCEGIISALEEAISIQDKKSKFSRILNTKIKKTMVSNELLGKMEIEFADSPNKPSIKELAYLEQLLAELVKKSNNRTVLLLLDEIQHLSTSKQFDPLAHALRTMLDKRQGKVKCILTGSSRHFMNLLLNDSKSPFYHFVESVPFPDLNDDFILFLRSKLIKEHKITVPQQHLKKSFKVLDYSPHWMMKVISHMITMRASVKSSEEYILQIIEATENYEGIESRLKPIDRLVFLALCKKENPFSKKLMIKIGKETDVKGVPPNIQRSIQRLSEINLISQVHKGEYNIEKPGMENYLIKK